MSQFSVAVLPETDQRCIKRGKCPWCLERLYENEGVDCCLDCGDTFVGTLTIED